MMKIFVGLGNAWKCSQVVPTPDLSTLLTKKGVKGDHVNLNETPIELLAKMQAL